MWAVLPIALKGILVTLDPVTTSFFRFFLSALLITPYLLARNRLPNAHKARKPKFALWLIAAGLLLSANYGFYIFGLDKTSVEAAQVIIQLAPMLLLLAGLWIFREPFSRIQWLGFLVFVSGLLVFFHHRLGDLFLTFNEYSIGMLLVVGAAFSWAGYAIMQKFLLQEFSSEECMMVIYWIGTLSFLPFCDFSTIDQLSNLQWGLLAFCGLNTLVAYGAFAEAMVHLEASRVSAIIALGPLVTVTIVQLVPIAGVSPEPLGIISLVGAAMLVAGSITTAIAKKVS